MDENTRRIEENYSLDIGKAGGPPKCCNSEVTKVSKNEIGRLKD